MNNKVFFTLSLLILSACSVESIKASEKQETITHAYIQNNKAKIENTAREMTYAVLDYMYANTAISPNTLWANLEEQLETLLTDCQKLEDKTIQIPNNSDMNEEKDKEFDGKKVALQFEKGGLEEYKKQVTNLTNLLKRNVFIEQIVLEVYENPTSKDLLIISGLIGHINKLKSAKNVSVVLKTKKDN